MNKENQILQEEAVSELRKVALKLIEDTKSSLLLNSEFKNQMIKTFLDKPTKLLLGDSTEVKFKIKDYEYTYTAHNPYFENKISFQKICSDGKGDYRFESFTINDRNPAYSVKEPFLKYSSYNLDGRREKVELSDSPEAIEKIHNFIASLSSKHKKQSSI